MTRLTTAPETSTETQPTLLIDHVLPKVVGNIVLIACTSDDLFWPEQREGMHRVTRFETLDDAEKASKAVESGGESPQVTVFNMSSGETALSQQIGQAVRAFSNRLIVYTKLENAPDTLFFAFGFHKLNVVGNTEADSKNRWYEFRLSHYKQPPDWLNERFWANPERFNLDDDSDLYIDSDDADEEE